MRYMMRPRDVTSGRASLRCATALQSARPLAVSAVANFRFSSPLLDRKVWQLKLRGPYQSPQDSSPCSFLTPPLVEHRHWNGNACSYVTVHESYTGQPFRKWAVSAAASQPQVLTSRSVSVSGRAHASTDLSSPLWSCGEKPLTPGAESMHHYPEVESVRFLRTG